MEGRKKLRLSKKNKIIGGVCGGVAECINADPTLVRIVMVLITAATIAYPLMAIAYIVLWAIVPPSD